MRTRFFTPPAAQTTASTNPTVLYNSMHSRSISALREKRLPFSARHNPYNHDRSCDYSDPRYIEHVLPKPK